MKISLILVMVVLLIGVTSAEQGSEKTYSNHSISFQIPANWSVTKDTHSSNDTQIVLSNGLSTIRFDIVDLPQMSWLRNSSSNEFAKFAIYSVVLGYYQKNILRQDSRNNMNWSAADKPLPDGIDGQLTFAVGGEGQKWIMAWSKPEYGEKFIGVYASFNGNFNTVDLSEGRSDWRYYMPILFYELLDSFRTNIGTNSAKKTIGLPTQKMTFNANRMLIHEEVVPRSKMKVGS